MVSRDLGITNCFRVLPATSLEGDALVVDIPVLSTGERARSDGAVRLCTVHLESRWNEKAYRLGQLARVTSLLKGAQAMDSKIIAGLVGGDMNAIDKREHKFHKTSDVVLKDVWEDLPAPVIPVLKPFQKDLTYGYARGNTWGYQSAGPRDRKRLDKFLYTDSIETVALDEAQDVCGKLGRLGIGLKVQVDAWEEKTTKFSIRRGKLVERPVTRYHSDNVVENARKRGSAFCEKLVRTKTDVWVSDHFGIAVGVKIP